MESVTERGREASKMADNAITKDAEILKKGGRSGDRKDNYQNAINSYQFTKRPS